MQLGVIAFGVTHNFQAAVGNHFVGVHVGRRASPALNHVHDKLVVQFALLELMARRDNRLGFYRIQVAQFQVGLSRRLFYVGKRMNEIGISANRFSGNGKVFKRPQGVDAPIGVLGDIGIAQKVVL